MDKLQSRDNKTKPSPNEILEQAYQEATSTLGVSTIKEENIRERIGLVSQGKGNKSCVRALLACALAKTYDPLLDIRKPYTKIGTPDVYSGRDYDEKYIGPFILKYALPCNETTAFLTPAFRNRNTTLTATFDLVGRPPQIYSAFLQLLADVHENKVLANDILIETIKSLIFNKSQNELRIRELYNNLKKEISGNILAAEAIIKIIEHHLSLSGSSRLPVLIVATIYKIAEKYLGEQVLPLEAHNAADKQTGSLGDLHITRNDNHHIVTVYEMKNRPVTSNDIELALIKITQHPSIHNYIFISTENVEQNVKDYASKMYARTGGIEIVVLDCLDFLRYFLHLFYRLREAFIDTYQEMVLNEPESAVSQNIKEALLLLRTAAEKTNISQ